MRMLDLKREVDKLPVEERLELAEYIRQTFRSDDPLWQAEIGSRLDACLQGKGHGEAELLALHDRLQTDER
jgi:hypothetical protein